MIRSVEAKGISIAQVYIDTVGPALKYKEKLQKFFPKYSFTVAEKADSKYPIVSAASVCAKVMRDRIVKNWRYPECDSLHLDAFETGSGYPADPDTKKFLEDSIDPVFGYSTLARFSWSTITKALDKGGCKCDFNEPDEEDEDPKARERQQQMFKSFFVKRYAGPSKSAAQTKLVAERIEPKTRTNADVFLGERSLSRVTLWT